jgi:hypothetical protein
LRYCLPFSHRPFPRLQLRRLGRTTGLALFFGLALPLAASATLDEQFDGGMPLVLKDGRIANVTVHTIPFATGSGELDAATSETLRTIFEPLATDCFLTAQAIGHVAPGITRDGDTLSAHRLARARADKIQATLAGFGMPQPSVASVWDWQFLLQESRVTLWVFSLTEGDDCDGTPLPKGEPLLAAADAEIDQTTAAPVTAAAAQPTATSQAPSSPQPGSPSPRSAAAVTEPAPPREIVAERPAEPAVLRAPAPVAAAIPTEEVVALPDAAARDPLATAAVAPAEPALSPTEPQPETVASEQSVASISPETARIAGAAGAPALAITFEMNSSYFPAGVGQELRAFLDSLPAEGPIEIELLGAVGNSPVRGASGEEAERYNAWMAERRIERVAEWLEQNAGDRQFTLAEQLVEDDQSRQVRLRAKVVSQ